MATIRRTLSPVPRPGTLLGGEACSVSSPLSKSTSCYSPQLEGFLDSPRSVFLPRFGRSLEKSKSRGLVWRRVLCHFIVCFVVGIFVGFTPNVSTMNLSMNVKSNRQAFSLELITPPENSQLHEAVSSNITLLLESRFEVDNATISEQLKAEQVVDDMLDGSYVVQTLAGFSDLSNQKLLIIVTPTTPRPFQAYYLNRLALTLKLIPCPLLWIVVEMTSQSSDTADILCRTGVMYRHLVCNKNLTEMNDRSLHQMNVALSHIEMHRLDGIVFFAHEENIYSIDLFEHLKQIRKFGTWMVAKLPDQKPEVNKLQAIISGPVCNGSQVTGWHTSDVSSRFRRFHADMSGFAFNSTILWDPKRWHRPTLEPIRQLDTVKDGTQASRFIEQVMEDESLMECLPLSSSRVMVWHVHIESSYSFYPHKWLMKKNLDVIAQLV